MPRELQCNILELPRPGCAVVELANDPGTRYKLSVHQKDEGPTLTYIERLESHENQSV